MNCDHTFHRLGGIDDCPVCSSHKAERKVYKKPKWAPRVHMQISSGGPRCGCLPGFYSPMMYATKREDVTCGRCLVVDTPVRAKDAVI